MAWFFQRSGLSCSCSILQHTATLSCSVRPWTVKVLQLLPWPVFRLTPERSPIWVGTTYRDTRVGKLSCNLACPVDKGLKEEVERQQASSEWSRTRIACLLL